jgi:hypothetical protein
MGSGDDRPGVSGVTARTEREGWKGRTVTILVVCLCVSVLVNALLINQYLQRCSDRAWQAKQEEIHARERRLQLARKEAQDLRWLERALERLANKAAAFERDLFGLSQDESMQSIWEAIEQDPASSSTLMPEAHQPFYVLFELIQSVVRAFIERLENEGRPTYEELLFFDELLTNLWYEYRIACNRDELPCFAPTIPPEVQ